VGFAEGNQPPFHGFPDIAGVGTNLQMVESVTGFLVAAMFDQEACRDGAVSFCPDQPVDGVVSSVVPLLAVTVVVFASRPDQARPFLRTERGSSPGGLWG
jgi:hypothetical protein